MHAGPRRPIRRRTLLRSIGGAAIGLGVAGLGATTATAHEKPTPAEQPTETDDGDTRTPDPDSYEPLARLRLAGTKELVTSADGKTGYAAVTDGYATIDFSTPSQPTVLAERRELLAEHENGPLRQVHDVAIDGDRLLVVGPANPVPDGLNAVVLVDISDPAAPQQIAVRETDFPIHNCDLQDGHAYLTANGAPGNPLVILDVRDGIREVGRWSLFDHDDRWENVPSSLRALHDVWIQDDIAYLAHWDAGTWLVDVSDPADPRVLSNVGGINVGTLADLDRTEANRESTTTPGNSHCVATDADATLMAVGRETWAIDDGATGGPSGIDLYDCTDPSAPEQLASIEPPPSPEPTFGGVWTTTHNFGFAEGVLYSSWYQGGVKRHDVSDPRESSWAPREQSWWRAPDDARFWTAQAAVPGEYFVAADMGVGGGTGTVAADAGVYVFPDTAGTQSPPPDPALTGEAEQQNATSTPATTATDTPTPDGVSSTRAPGFGVGSALLAFGIDAWRRLHQSAGRGRE